VEMEITDVLVAIVVTDFFCPLVLKKKKEKISRIEFRNMGK
jgi:hypothetical protein